MLFSGKSKEQGNSNAAQIDLLDNVRTDVSPLDMLAFTISFHWLHLEQYMIGNVCSSVM